MRKIISIISICVAVIISFFIIYTMHTAMASIDGVTKTNFNNEEKQIVFDEIMLEDETGVQLEYIKIGYFTNAINITYHGDILDFYKTKMGISLDSEYENFILSCMKDDEFLQDKNSLSFNDWDNVNENIYVLPIENLKPYYEGVFDSDAAVFLYAYTDIDDILHFSFSKTRTSNEFYNLRRTARPSAPVIIFDLIAILFTFGIVMVIVKDTWYNPATVKIWEVTAAILKTVIILIVAVVIIYFAWTWIMSAAHMKWS